MTTGLLVAGGGFQGLPMLHALRALGARVIVADCYENNPNRYQVDVYAVVPPIAERESFDRAIVELCLEHDVDIVFATTAHDTVALAELAPRLRDSGVVVAVSEHQLLTAWADKVDCLTELAASGFPVLPFIDPDLGGHTLPLIGKVRGGWGSRELVSARSSAELEKAHAADSQRRLYWQPLLESYSEWSVDFAIDESGSVSPLVLRERLRSSGGFAVVSHIRHSAPISKVASAAAQFVAKRGGCGNINLQILVDASGAHWLNDLNLRPGTSSTAALGDGVNFAAFMLGQASGTGDGPDFLHVRTLRDMFLPLPFEHEIAGVAFDLDDCLIDQKAWLDEKLSLLLSYSNAFPGDEQQTAFEREARRLIDEGPWDRLIDIALFRSGLDASLAGPLIDRWRTAHPARVSLYPDTAAAIGRLRAAGIRLALVTDNPAASQRQKLARLAAELSPDVIVLTDDLGKPKPAAAGYEAAAERLGVDASRMVAVGDSPWRDAIGALDAGYAGALIAPRRAGMGNPSRSRFALAYPEHARRTHWVDDLWALPEMLQLSQPVSGR